MLGDMQSKEGFQTSFIPKTPLVSKANGQKVGLGGVLSFVSIIVFVISISVYVGAFLYRIQINSSIKSITEQLASVKMDLQSKDSLMKEMIGFDYKLKIAGEMLNNHTSLRSVFSFLEESTMENLRFSRFDYKNKGDGTIDFMLDGEARAYSTVALQSQRFVDSKKTGDKDFSNVIFSNLNPNLAGNVIFKVASNVRPDLVYYSNIESSQ